MPIWAPAAGFAATIVLVAAVAGAQTPQQTPQQAPPSARPAHAPRTTARAGDPRPGALMPGFETLADGSTRLFLELSKPVTYTTQTAPGKITYVLKGTHVRRRNNENPLVTVHFNTPVTSARLVPHGRDLWFVLDLRAAVKPAVTVDPAKDGAVMMRIDLPKGDYLPAQPSGPAAPPAESAP